MQEFLQILCTMRDKLISSSSIGGHMTGRLLSERKMGLEGMLITLKGLTFG
jgi:hypothetical protein